MSDPFAVVIAESRACADDLVAAAERAAAPDLHRALQRAQGEGDPSTVDRSTGDRSRDAGEGFGADDADGDDEWTDRGWRA